MEATLSLLTDTDLLFVIDSLAPESDRSRMLRVLREDDEILRAMLADERLFSRIAAEPEVPLRVSPRLLFCVLMARVKRDLENLGYTVEPGHTVVFDAPRVASLLEDTRILDYLVEVLASFVRVQSTSFTVRVRKGVWRRYHVSDLDVMTLIRLAAAVDETERFAWYRRIGDLCLFLTGVFPEYVQGPQASPSARALARAAYMENGRNFYRAASRHPRTDAEVADVLARLADAFDLAVKPLDHMASRYLGSLREQLFHLQ